MGEKLKCTKMEKRKRKKKKAIVVQLISGRIDEEKILLVSISIMNFNISYNRYLYTIKQK